MLKNRGVGSTKDKWSAWPPPKDCHPTCLDTWYPTPFHRDRLPKIMRTHSFYGIGMID